MPEEQCSGVALCLSPLGTLLPREGVTGWFGLLEAHELGNFKKLTAELWWPQYLSRVPVPSSPESGLQGRQVPQSAWTVSCFPPV